MSSAALSSPSNDVTAITPSHPHLEMSLPLTSRKLLPKTVAVLGASYGGASAARFLARELPQGWRVVVVDRNTHFNHLYVLPRYALLPQHAHKAFIPYTGMSRGAAAPSGEGATSPQRLLVLHAQVTALSAHSATLSRNFPEYGLDNPVLDFDYAIYALGSHLPAPINLWGPRGDDKDSDAYSGTKVDGISWLQKFHAVIERAPSVLVVGGGALGIQYAADIAEIFPDKPVTLLHSRAQLLPRFDPAMHTEILSALDALNIKTILGERLDLSSVPKPSEDMHGPTVRTVRTQSGTEISAGLVLLCTGQTPNTGLMKSFIPDSIVPDGASKGMIRVKRTMQVAVPTPERTSADDGDDSHLSVPYPHLFAIGDAADAFGAINAGHIARDQGEVASRNIIELIQAPEATLQRYTPAAPGIKITLGLGKSLYQMKGVVGKKYDVSDDLNASFMWKAFGVDTDETGMHQ